MYIHVSRNQNFDYFVILWRHTTCKGVFDIDVESLKISSNNYVFTIRHYLIIKLKKSLWFFEKIKILDCSWMIHWVHLGHIFLSNHVTVQLTSFLVKYSVFFYYFEISLGRIKKMVFHVLDCRNVFSWIYECEIKWHSIMIRCTLPRC